MSTPLYPEIVVTLTGADGNSLSIVSLVSRAIKRELDDRMLADAFVAEALSGDRDNVINTCFKWVTVK